MTNAEKRITKRDYFNAIIDYCSKNDEDFMNGISAAQMMDFAIHEIELLAKKNVTKSGERKMTPQQVGNEKIKTEILDFLADGKLHTISEMIKNVPSLVAMDSVSPQRVSALLSQLSADKGTGEVERQVIKRVTYFKCIDL